MLLCNNKKSILQILHEIDQKVREILLLLRFLYNLQIFFFFIISALKQDIEMILTYFKKKYKRFIFKALKALCIQFLNFLKFLL